MENIFYSWGIIWLIYKIWVMLYRPARKDKKIDEKDMYSLLEWAKENPRIIIPTLSWIWLPIGLFTHLWFLFLFLILLESSYYKIYDWSRATLYKHHKLWWNTHHITELVVLFSILIIHFYSIK